ncbi:MAG: hypothetical protein OEY36_03615 [Gammaproteobacteria bacterium]|nr:hypothetical protein [Gammaproteobacteria bacterium]
MSSLTAVIKTESGCADTEIRNVNYPHTVSELMQALYYQSQLLALH